MAAEGGGAGVNVRFRGLGAEAQADDAAGHPLGELQGRHHLAGLALVAGGAGADADALGWEGGSLEPYAPGCCIGGDRFGNYEGTLPEGDYHECDIDTLGADRRGAKRLVYSDDGRIYYTENHYESFTLLYGEED